MMRFMLTTILIFAAVTTALGDQKCTNIGGNCQNDAGQCPGVYQSRLCDGGKHRRCCLIGDVKCRNLNGQCQNNWIACPGRYKSKLCGGPRSRQCCLPSGIGSFCSGITVISRKHWAARAAKSTSRLRTPVDQVFVHHTDTPGCKSRSRCAARVKGIQNYHMKKWSDIGYSFLVGEDGNIYEGRGWDRIGSHTKTYNSVSLAISVIGDYSKRNPNSAALKAVQAWLNCGVSKGKITKNYKLYGHRDGRSTTCPGDALYATIKSWTHYNNKGKPHH